MKFGTVPLDQALGAILAHSADLKGGRLRKGKVLDQGDLNRLAAAGWNDVIVAQLDPGDLDEDTAAAQIGAAIQGRGLRASVAATGRVNLIATGPGIADFDADIVVQLNQVNPLITLATVPRYARVSADDLVATIKIIAYGVPQLDVAAVSAMAAPIAVRPPQILTATLIETSVGREMSVKGRNALSMRLTRLGIELSPRIVVPHQADPLAKAIAEAPGEVVFILTASATSDPDDVGPDALRRAGGRVTRFGMPVDPGNLLFLGDLGTKPVIGLPGCARSPAMNGADWVLERVICGIPVSSDDIAAMGVGGLLKEIPARGRPRRDQD